MTVVMRTYDGEVGVDRKTQAFVVIGRTLINNRGHNMWTERKVSAR